MLLSEEQMGIIYQIHSIFGERVLPLLIVVAAIWFTVAWKPGQQPHRAARLFPILVDIQFTLGLIWWIYLIASGGGAIYLGFPFILHPLMGLLSVGIAHMSVSAKGPFSRLGRWSALAGLGALLVSVLAGVVLARTA